MAHWPPIDRRAWAKAITVEGPLDRLGRASTWAEISLQKVEGGYGRWILWLKQTGNLNPRIGPIARVTPERITAYVIELRSRNTPVTVLGRITDLIHALSFMSPRADLSWLRDLKTKLSRNARSSQQKQLRMRPSADLFRLGLRLMKEAEGSPWDHSHPPSIAYRTGLMIAFLAARPLRMRNFAGMCVGVHLVRQGAGYNVVFQNHETKTKWPINLPVPSRLVSFIDRYLSYHRPLMLGYNVTGRRSKHEMIPASRAFWISENGAAMTARTISYHIERATKKAFGTSVNPHLFRDCAATSFAIEDPNYIQFTAALLGVRALRTVEANYNHAPPEAGIRRYLKALTAIRNELRLKNEKHPTRQSRSLRLPGA